MPTLSRSKPAMLVAIALAAAAVAAPAADGAAPPAAPGHARVPFAQMPDIAPIGVHIDKYFDPPELAKGPPVDPAKGYRLEELGRGLHMVADNGYQSMLMSCQRSQASCTTSSASAGDPSIR